LAVQILALNNPALTRQMIDWRSKQSGDVAETPS